MPSVTPTAIDAEARLSAYLNSLMGPIATRDIVAAVANDEPQIAAATRA